MVRIKICGITNLGDAQLAAGNGATALGFNFYRWSPRFVEPSDAADVISQLPGDVRKVGVFVNSELEEIIRFAGISGIDTIQLHGDEDAETVSAVAAASGLNVIKALRVNTGFDYRAVLLTGAETVLLDTYAPDAFGGTGETFNWDVARQACLIFKRTYLAGGLGPENIADAIAATAPYGVDACSALESSPGKKDTGKLLRFLKMAATAGKGTEKT